MRGLVSTLIFAVSCFAAALGAVQPVQRDWIGELRIGDRNTLVELKLETGGSPLAGTISYPVSGEKAIALSALSTEQGRVSFAWLDETEKMIFEGSISNGILAGNVRAGNKVGTLQLVPVAQLEHDAEGRILGYYELSPGRVLSITSFPRGSVYVDYTSGRAGVLFPLSETDFFAGPAFQVPVPIMIRVGFTVELWRHVTIPVLALYGGKDLNVPAEKNVIAFDAALRSAGNRNYAIKVFPNANHDGLDTDKAVLTGDQFRYLQRYALGYFSTQLDWALSHVPPRTRPDK